jgi:TolA-binding protein
MTHPVDVHPEDLLDRERRGLLVPDERRRLDAHAAHCRACALERNVVFEFARERKLGRSDDDAVSRLVLGTVAAAGEAENAPRYSEFRLKTRSGFRRWALMSAVAAAGTGAFLAGTVWMHAPRESWSDVASSTVVALARPTPPGPAALPADPPPVAAHDDGEASAESATPASERPSIAVRPHLEAVEPPRRAALPPADRPGADLSASELFSKANEARRRGDTSEAVRLYRLLRQRFAGSREEVTSRVGLGRLLLDRLDEPSSALPMFDRYLADMPDGTLAEEAHLGRALALMRLGRIAEERQAWQQLLTAHPRSVQAERARKRLEELH